jgi:iron complex outermembrane receptor protein
VVVEAGTLGTRLTRARVGHQFANGAELALAATYSHSDGMERLYFPAFDAPETNDGIAENLDAEGTRQLYSRLDFGNLTFTAAYGTRRREVPTASFGTLFNHHDPEEQTTDRHTLLDAEYVRSLKGTRVTFRGSYDRFSYDGLYPYPGETADTLTVGHNTVLGSRWTAGVRATRPLPGRQTLTAGAEFIDNFQQEQTSRILNPPSVPLDIDRSSTQHAVYVQDEIRLSSWLIMNAGLRYDGYDEFDRITPRAALIAMPSSAQSFKYLFGQAFRAPNEYELNTFYFGQDVMRLRPETIDTHEVVWERYTNDWLRTSVSGYWYRADRLITPVPGSDGFFGVTYVNQGEVRARGLELEAQMRLPAGAQAQASYSLQRAIDQDTDAELPNSPRHMAKGRISVPWPTRNTTVALEALYMSSRATLSGSRVGSAAVVNATVHHALSPRWELFATVRNLFDTTYADPASTQHLQDSIVQNGRTARVGLRLNLWTK